MLISEKYFVLYFGVVSWFLGVICFFGDGVCGGVLGCLLVEIWLGLFLFCVGVWGKLCLCILIFFVVCGCVLGLCFLIWFGLCCFILIRIREEENNNVIGRGVLRN